MTSLHTNRAASCKTAWKTGDWVADDLPADEPARDTSREVL